VSLGLSGWNLSIDSISLKNKEAVRLDYIDGGGNVYICTMALVW